MCREICTIYSHTYILFQHEEATANVLCKFKTEWKKTGGARTTNDGWAGEHEEEEQKEDLNKKRATKWCSHWGAI